MRVQPNSNDSSSAAEASLFINGVDGNRFRNPYHVESEHGVQLDGAVEIPKQYGYREQYKIDGVSDVMSEQLDELAHKHPNHQRTKGQRLCIRAKGLRALVA